MARTQFQSIVAKYCQIVDSQSLQHSNHHFDSQAQDSCHTAFSFHMFSEPCLKQYQYFTYFFHCENLGPGNRLFVLLHSCSVVLFLSVLSKLVKFDHFGPSADFVGFLNFYIASLGLQIAKQNRWWRFSIFIIVRYSHRSFWHDRLVSFEADSDQSLQNFTFVDFRLDFVFAIRPTYNHLASYTGTLIFVPFATCMGQN